MGEEVVEYCLNVIKKGLIVRLSGPVVMPMHTATLLHVRGRGHLMRFD